MTDREMLELAAKAANIDIVRVDTDFELASRFRTSSQGWREWNPLNDDGDLQRLLVACSIDLRFDDIERVVEARHQHTSYGEHEEYGSDKAAATRRAGVRAAAAIGEQMEKQA